MHRTLLKLHMCNTCKYPKHQPISGNNTEDCMKIKVFVIIDRHGCIRQIVHSITELPYIHKAIKELQVCSSD